MNLENFKISNLGRRDKIIVAAAIAIVLVFILWWFFGSHYVVVPSGETSLEAIS